MGSFDLPIGYTFYYHVWVSREYTPDGQVVWWAEYREIPVRMADSTRDEAIIKLWVAGREYVKEMKARGEEPKPYVKRAFLFGA